MCFFDKSNNTLYPNWSDVKIPTWLNTTKLNVDMYYFTYTYYHLVNLKRNSFIKICSLVCEIWKWRPPVCESSCQHRKLFSLCTCSGRSSEKRDHCVKLNLYTKWYTLHSPHLLPSILWDFLVPQTIHWRRHLVPKICLQTEKKYTNRQKDRHGHHNTQLPISGRVKSKTIDLMTAKECHNRKKTHKWQTKLNLNEHLHLHY